MTDYRSPPSKPPLDGPSPHPPAGDPVASASQDGAAAPANEPRGGPPAPAADPGRTMGIVAFIMSFFVTFFFVQIGALILGIVANVRSRKAGYSNRWAVAAIIISSVLMVLTLIVAILAGMALGSGRW